MHFIFQTLEWWAGISSKGGPTNQTQCDFGFIALLEHLVLLSAQQDRGRKHVQTLTALSPDVFLFLLLNYEDTASSREMKLIPQQLDLPRLIFMSMGMKALGGQLFQIPVQDSCLEQERLRNRSPVSGMTWFTFNSVTLNVVALIRMMWTTATSQIC